MATPTAHAPPTEARVSTGNRDLDSMLEGGLVARRPYLVVGPSGTGKTTLALQFLCEGIRNHERALLVTIEEPPNEARLNHPGLSPELERVDVFDAIPDIMRYERVPFKDIASVRYAQPFAAVPLSIRQSPELSSVEVTLAALEQMLRTEVLRKGYSRVAIDSLTALQYFCMKGFEPVAGAQTFLRFLSDLRVTTIITVESPLEDVETPERALARGEIRLFRWEHENRTVRAIGVEKFRGSPHDVRLHPYRIGPHGLDINLELTISRDTRQIIEPAPPAFAIATPTPIPLEEVISPVDPLAEEVRDLVLVGADLGPVRTEIEAALGALAAGDIERSRGHMSRATSQVIALSAAIPPSPETEVQRPVEVEEAFQRLVQRGESARAGFPPTRLPPPRVLEVELEWVLSLIPPAAVPSEAEPAEAVIPIAEGPALELIPEAEVVAEAAPAAGAEPPLPSVEEPPIAVTVEAQIPKESASEELREPTPPPIPTPAAEPAPTPTEPQPPTVPEPPTVPVTSPRYPAPPEPPSRPPVAAPPEPTRVLHATGAARPAEPPAPPRAEEPRPPLPSFEVAAEKPTKAPGHGGGSRGTGTLVSTGRARAPRLSSTPGGPRLPATGTVPTGGAAEVQSPTTPGAPSKRRKKPTPAVRKKPVSTAVRSEPVHVPHAAPTPPPLPGSHTLHPPEVPLPPTSPPRAKKRTARKRKAPTATGESAGPLRGAESSSDAHSTDSPALDPEPKEGA